jgi:predicted nucleic acid-binding protein
MRVLFDTAILARANPKASGIARELLERVREGRHALIVSPFLLEEVERVLNYPRLQAQYKLSAGDIADFVEYLETIAEVVDPVVSEPYPGMRANSDTGASNGGPEGPV